MAALIVVKGDDWIGIYADGALIFEGHRLDTTNAIEIAIERRVTSVTERWVNLDWLHDSGSLPHNIDGVIWEGEPFETVVCDED